MPLPAPRLIVTGIAIIALGATAGLLTADDRPQTSPTVRGLTAVDGVKVGHYTLAERPTGYTVILTEGGAVAEGNVGAAAGATIGKLRGSARAMKGGLGTASIQLENGLTVAALVAVNAVGDVIDPATGRVVAGVRTEDGRRLADARRLLRAGEVTQSAAGENTTIGVVATNAVLTKPQATKIAQMAHDGYARAIVPVHTPFDGDTIFAVGTGTWDSLATLGALAADVMAEAIVRAATQATGIPGYPAAGDLDGSRP